MKFSLAKILLKFVLPTIGIASISGGIVSAIMLSQKTIIDPSISPTSIFLSNSPGNVNAGTNSKTIVNRPIKVEVEPKNALANIDWQIFNEQGDSAPSQIYINNKNELVIDRGLQMSLNDTTWNICGYFDNAAGESLQSNSLNFHLNLTYQESDIIGIRYKSDGSTSLTAKMDEKKNIDKPWLCEIQNKNGLWNIGNSSYEIISENEEAKKILSIDKDGYLSTTGTATFAETFSIQIKATAAEDSSFTVTSESINITILGDDTVINSLEFISSFTRDMVNFHSNKTLNTPFIVSAYDMHGVLVPNPKIDYYLVNAPQYISIDAYGFLHVNAINISSYVSVNFQVYARSQVCTDKFTSINVNIIIYNFLDSDLYNFDPATGTILSLKPKFSVWISNQSGILNLPNNLSNIPLTGLGNGLFQGCEGLKKIILPNTITNIGSCCFRNCSNLTSIEVNSNPNIGAECFSTYHITNVTVNNAEFVATLINAMPCWAENPELITDSGNNERSLGGPCSITLMHNYSALSSYYAMLYPQGCLWSGTNSKTQLIFGGSYATPILQETANSTIQSMDRIYNDTFLYFEYTSIYSDHTWWNHCDVHRKIYRNYWGATVYTLKTILGSVVLNSRLEKNYIRAEVGDNEITMTPAPGSYWNFGMSAHFSTGESESWRIGNFYGAFLHYDTNWFVPYYYDNIWRNDCKMGG